MRRMPISRSTACSPLNPVGRLVLAIFGFDDPELVELSNDVCTGLQLVEHWQDVAEDFGAGRVYLPVEDQVEFGVDEGTIAKGDATAAFRRLMAFECARARRLLRSGDKLAAQLHGWARVAISGFVGGGVAQLDAIEQRRFDVFSGSAKAPKTSVARRAFRCLAGLEGETTMSDLVDAYQHCEEVTRAEARNFSYGIRLLPHDKRDAMSALYALRATGGRHR